MKKFLRVSLASVILMSVMMVSLVGTPTSVQASDSKVYSGTNVVIAAGATYEITPDTDGVILGTLVITSNKAGYQLQGCNPNQTWTTVVSYGLKNMTLPVANNGTRIKNPLSTSITVTYTLTCTVTYGPFVAMDIDDARHTTSDIVYEWWYMDANLNNGYSMTSVWYYPGNWIQFAVYDPQGNKVVADQLFPTSTASTTKCDVQMGTNRLVGSYPKWNVNFMNGNTGCNLQFNSLVEGWKTPPAGVKVMTTSPYTYMGWVIAQPRASVTGTLTVNGTTMNVTGTGYHDHNWGNTTLHDLFDHWYWGRIFLPGYTCVYSTGNLTDALGGAANNLWLTFKDKTFYDVNLLVTDSPTNMVTEPISTAQYPQTLTFTIPAGSLVHGTVILVLNQLIEIGYPLGAVPGDGRAYFRFLSNANIDLYFGTNHVTVSQPMLHELMIP